MKLPEPTVQNIARAVLVLIVLFVIFIFAVITGDNRPGTPPPQSLASKVIGYSLYGAFIGTSVLLGAMVVTAIRREL